MAKDFMTRTELEKIEGREGSMWAEIMFKISQRCQTGEDRQRAMHHCMEIMDTPNWFSINSRKILKLLNHDGILSTFEVSVNEDLYDNGVGVLITQIMNKIDSYGVISGVMINFFVSFYGKLRPEEMQPLADWLNSDQCDFDAWCGVADDSYCDNLILRATVLVMHDPIYGDNQERNKSIFEMKRFFNIDDPKSWSCKHNYPKDEVRNTFLVLAKLISPRLEAFKALERCGYCGCYRNMDEWNEAIQKMIDAFLLLSHFPEIRHTDEERQVISNGLDLFGKYFQYLYDSGL
jgi:hypothetical protein